MHSVKLSWGECDKIAVHGYFLGICQFSRRGPGWATAMRSPKAGKHGAGRLAVGSVCMYFADREARVASGSAWRLSSPKRRLLALGFGVWKSGLGLAT